MLASRDYADLSEGSLTNAARFDALCAVVAGFGIAHVKFGFPPLPITCAAKA